MVRNICVTHFMLPAVKPTIGDALVEALDHTCSKAPASCSTTYMLPPCPSECPAVVFSRGYLRIVHVYKPQYTMYTCPSS